VDNNKLFANLLRRINRRWWVQYYETPVFESIRDEDYTMYGIAYYRWLRRLELRKIIDSSKVFNATIE